MEEKPQLSLLSYNLYCLPGIATLFSPSSCPLSEERSTHFLEHIPMYDILALQEVWNPRYKDVEKHAKKKGMHVVGSSSPNAWNFLKLRVFGGGLMIISKHPIVEKREIVYDEGSNSDGYTTKGALYAKIQVGTSSFIHVFNTHLQASYGKEFEDNNPFATVRRKQLQKLSSFIKKTTNDDEHPILVMGDFNVNARKTPDDGSDSQEYREMSELLQSEHFHLTDVLKHFNEGLHPITYGGQGVRAGHNSVGGQRLDFLFELRRKTSQRKHKFTKGEVVKFEVKEKVFTHISDHFGCTASFEMDITEETKETLAHANISFSASTGST